MIENDKANRTIFDSYEYLLIINSENVHRSTCCHTRPEEWSGILDKLSLNKYICNRQ